MGAFTHIETDTGTNVDISAATAVGAYSSTGDKLIMVDVSIDAVAGNGDYVMYVTRQIGGSGSAYRILPQTTMTAASGLTAISAQSGWITVRNGDVLTCYVDGLAGDTSTPDWSTRWFELAGVTAGAVADAVWDEATADHTTASSFGALDANVDAILADTGTDGVKIASAQTVATVTNLTNLPSIPANWITAAGIATGAITSAKFAAGAIDASAIASNAIAAAKIATGAITSAKFAAGAIDAAAIATDAIGSAEISAAAVTKIQNGLALEATLTAIKGAGWSNIDDTLAMIKDSNIASEMMLDDLTTDLVNGGRLDLLIDAIKAKTDNLPATPADEATLTAIKGDGWTNETLAKIVADIAALSVGSGATPQQIWEYATRTLTAGTNIDLSALATAADLATLDGKVDTVDGILDDLHDTDIPAIKAKTDNLPATPASAGEYAAAIAALQADLDNPDQYKANISTLATNTDVIDLKERIVAVDTIADAILEDTGTTIPATLATIAGYTDGIAGDVWSNPIRTLTVPAVAMSDPEDGTTLTLYKDADINIEFTGLTIPTGAKKVVFTIKDNLDDADTAAALQATYQLTAVPAETHTLNYINSATPPTLTNPVTFTVTTDSVEFDMTAAAAYYLPRYERGYLKWDLKLITATTVQILQQGLVQILGTSTRAVA